MKFTTCLLALFIASTMCLTAGTDMVGNTYYAHGKDRSYNYNYKMPFKPLVNYTASGHPYFFCPDPSYAYLAYPYRAEAIYGHYYSTAPYNSSAKLARHDSCGCGCD